MKNKIKWVSILFAGLLVLIIILASCTNTETTSATATTTKTATQTATQTATSTITSTVTSTTTAIALSGTITEAGSTTVQPLAELLAEEFMEDNPGVTIIIQGGGSSVGIKSADEGTVDIGAASRDIKSTEPALVTHILARDGIAVVLHPSNSVSDLTKEQVKGIFAGNITNWSEVGGADQDIHIAAREEGSGTRTSFQEMVMGEDEIVKTAILQSSNGALMQVVKGDKNAIGFLSFGYLDDTVKAVSIDGIEASEENAKTGTYPIVRPLFFLTKEQPIGVVKAFIEYCMSTSAQEIVSSEGYISVK